MVDFLMGVPTPNSASSRLCTPRAEWLSRSDARATPTTATAEK